MVRLCDSSRQVAPLVAIPREDTQLRAALCALDPPISIEGCSPPLLLLLL
jgi:hypothetical protein